MGIALTHGTSFRQCTAFLRAKQENANGIEKQQGQRAKTLCPCAMTLTSVAIKIKNPNIITIDDNVRIIGHWWERMDSNHRSRSSRFTVCPL